MVEQPLNVHSSSAKNSKKSNINQTYQTQLHSSRISATEKTIIKTIHHFYSPDDKPASLIVKLKVSLEKLRPLTSKLNDAIPKTSKQQPPSATAFINGIETVVTKFLEDIEKEINKLRSELKDSRDCVTRR
jgi:hypothetical protein